MMRFFTGLQLSPDGFVGVGVSICCRQVDLARSLSGSQQGRRGRSSPRNITRPKVPAQDFKVKMEAESAQRFVRPKLGFDRGAASEGHSDSSGLTHDVFVS